MPKTLALLLVLLVAHGVLGTPIGAQFSSGPDIPKNIVDFSLSTEPEDPRPGEHFRVIIRGEVTEGWHIYSLVPSDQPLAPPPTEVDLRLPTAEWVAPVYESAPIIADDPLIGLVLSYHKREFSFYQNARLQETQSSAAQTLEGSVRYQACSDEICLPPKVVQLSKEVEFGVGAIRSAYANPTYRIDETPPPLNEGEVDLGSQGLIPFLLLAIGAGLLALLTPCVFPMIPITIAYFTKKSEQGQGAAKLAGTFGLGIVVTYTITGMGFSVLLGATGAVRFASNGWVNLAIGLAFMLFALSMMGFFTLNLPAKWVDRADRLSRRRSGVLGVMLTGLAFTLTSFTCTVQFVGTLLLAASQGQWFWPVLGMIVFSAVFATPFIVLGLFPKWIQSVRTQSGPWLEHTKVVVGLVELAAAAKFLSNADLVWQWNLLTREVVLLLWIALAVVAGAFLFGTIRIRGLHVEKNGALGFSFALGFVFLSLYLSQGLGGKPLDIWTDSFLPPSQRSTLVSNAIPPSRASNLHSEDLSWLDDLDAALVEAKRQNKPVFIDFTGYTCVNCRWMERNIFTRPRVYAALRDQFVLVQLYTDGGERAEANQQMQVERFHSVALPLYVVLSPDNQVISKHAGIMRQPEEFLRFLQVPRSSI